MGDGSGNEYLDGNGGSEDGDEQEDESRQSGVHEYDDDDPSPEKPPTDEENQDGTEGTPTPTPTPTGGGGDGSGAGGVELPGDVDIVEDSPEESEDDSGEHEPDDSPKEEPPERDPPKQEPSELDPDLEEPEEPEQDEAEDEDKDDEDDEEEDQQPKVVQYSDPWDNMGWGLYPLMLKIEEEYGHAVDLHYSPVAVREFKSPEEMVTEWESDARRHQMPINTDVWQDDPPESTALANRAYLAAQRQGEARSKQYLRRLRVAAIVEGMNIEDRVTLFELAKEVGLDADTLEEVCNDVDVQESRRDPDPPRTVFHVDGEEVTHSGYLHYDDIIDIFDQVDIERQDPQSLAGFVDEYGPVTVKEVREVYDEYDRDEAITELENVGGIEPISIGNTTFWTTFR